MRGKSVDELTQQAIKRAYSNGEGSYARLAVRFGVSESSVKRICKGINLKSKSIPAEVVIDAISHGAHVTIEGIDLTQHLADDIKLLKTKLSESDPKSFEGVMGVKLKYMQYLEQLNPPTLSQAVDQLIARPDFDPDEFVRLLKARYGPKAS